MPHNQAINAPSEQNSAYAGGRTPVHLFFLIFSAIIGNLFIILTPVSRNFDEPAHLLKIFSYSEAHAAGAPIPSSLRQFLNDSLSQNSPPALPQQHIKFINTFNRLSHREDFTPVAWLERNPADAYSPLSYWPAIVTTSIVKAIHPSSPLLFLSARLSLFWINTLMLYFVIRRSIINPWIPCLISLLPMPLFLRSGVSADSLTFSYSLLFFHFLLSSRHTPSPRNFYSLLLSGCLLALSKNVYVLLPALCITVPTFSELPWLRQRWQQLAVLLGLPLFLAALWNYYVIHYLHFNADTLNDFHTFLGFSPITPWKPDMQGQLAFITTHPLDYIHILITTLILWFQYYAGSIIGIQDVNNSSANLSPHGLLLLACFVLLCLLPRKVAITGKIRAALLLISLLLIVVVFTTLYLTFCKVGQEFILGVQGRYFLPILLPFILTLPTVSITPRYQKLLQLGTITAVAAANMESLYRLYLMYYA